MSILIFHRVLPEYDPLRPNEPTEAEFAQQMSVLRQYFQPLPLLEAVERLREGSLPPRSVCVTFDDGYADNAEYAMPVLKRYAIPATIFVATGFLNGGRMFNDTVIETVRGVQGERLDLRPFDLDDYPVATTADRLAAIAEILNTIKHLQPDRREAVTGAIESFAESLPDNLMMTDEQVRSLVNNGLEVGAHTVHHPILASVDAQTALQEISTCKAQLEALLQREVLSFAYPNGRPGIDYRQEHRDMVSSCGFRTAVATHWGAAVASSDPYQLPRFTPWDTQPARYAARLLLNYRRGDSLVA
ncbi:MAG: polysaccharide deacetylase family protein [Halioglobus sp.]|nr:polysaccharide deacetylase family protein [Halioglobus sp.]